MVDFRRAPVLTAAIALSAFAWAGDGFLGTKSSPTAGPMAADGGGVGFMSFLQMMIALAIVFALLKFVLPKVASRLNKRIVTKIGSEIRIEESAAFAGGSLYIVSAKSKTLLLSVHAQGVSCLADLTEPKSEPEQPAFQDIVDREMEGPLQPFAVIEREVPPPMSEVDPATALERLRRLTGA